MLRKPLIAGASLIVLALATPAEAARIKMGADQGTVCDATTEGDIDYDSTAHEHKFCNGTNWITIAGGGVGADSLDFDDFVDAMALDASTSITADNAEVLSIVNTGTGDSFLVEDSTSDTSPFVIKADGKVGIGTASPSNYMHLVVPASGGFMIDSAAASGAQTALFLYSMGVEKWKLFNVPAGSDTLSFTTGSTANAFNFTQGGRMGFGPYAFAPSYDISFDGETARTIGMEREQTADTAGRSLTLLAGGATAGASDKEGGDLVLSGGVGTGTGTSKIFFTASPGAEATDTEDNTLAEIGRVTGGGYVQFTGTAGAGDTMLLATGDDTPGAGTRMVWYPRKAAFRAGHVPGAQWDDANVGDYSAAFGYGNTASGQYSTAMGTGNIASSWYSTAMGYSNTAAGATAMVWGSNNTALADAASTAWGYYTTASGEFSTAFGREVKAGDGVNGSGKGNYSVAIGLGDPTAANAGEYPKVEGVSSFGIFMGDQKNVNISANNIMALLGGRLIIDPDTTSAANTNVSTGAQQLELDVEGDIGAVNYCDKDGNNCFTAANVAGGGAADSLDFDDFVDAMALDASTSITADGTEVLSIVNTGTGNTFLVEDEAADATPFVIDAAGQVGIGTTTPTSLLELAGGSIKIGATHGLVSTSLNGTNSFVVNAGSDMWVNIGTAGAFNVADGGGNVRLHVESTGNVGIGAASPASRIHGVTSLAAATGNEIAYQLNYTTNKATSGNDTGLLISMTDTASPGTSLGIDYQVGGASKFSVNSVGRVTAEGISANSSTYYGGYFIASGASPAVYGQGSAGGIYGVTSNTNYAISGQSWVTTSGFFQTYNTNADANSAPTLVTRQGTNQTTAHLFEAQNSAGTALTVIDSAGKVGIGTASPSVELEVSGDINYTGILTDTSDRRMKENIVSLPPGQLERILGLKPVSFTMKGQTETELGLVAQDVEPLFPSLVRTGNDSMKSINYIGLIAPVISAMQEQQKEIDALRAEIDALKAVLGKQGRPQ